MGCQNLHGRWPSWSGVEQPHARQLSMPETQATGCTLQVLDRLDLTDFTVQSVLLSGLAPAGPEVSAQQPCAPC